MISFKDLFTFRPPEVACVFSCAQTKRCLHGLKLLQAPMTCGYLFKSSIQPFGRLLIIVPRASGKAHERNRIKRQIRSIFYEEKLYQKPALWVLFVRKDAMTLSFDSLKKFCRESFV